MKVEQKIIETVHCDSCGVVLKNPDYYKNDGSFQATYTSIGDKDFCLSCMGKMFSLYIKSNKVTDVEIDNLMKSLKPLNSRTSIQFDFSKLKLPKSFEELKKYTENLNRPSWLSKERISDAYKRTSEKINKN